MESPLSSKDTRSDDSTQQDPSNEYFTRVTVTDGGGRPSKKRSAMPLHMQILLGLVVGAACGGLVNWAGDPAWIALVSNYIRPLGTLFIRLITMIAAPLVLASLIVGAASISEPGKLGRIGVKTVALYLSTTALAITIGLVLAALLKPGAGIPQETSARLLASYQTQTAAPLERAENLSPIDLLLSLVPANPFEALATGNMLQIVFFALLAGIALTLIPPAKAEPVIRFFDGFTDLLIKIVDLVMRLAPIGVLALVMAVTAEFGFGILGALGWYATVVLLGLLLHFFGVYGAILRVLVGRRMPLARFYRAMTPVHLVAFSSSSSAATLPINIETSQRRLGVSERVSAFVLPLGATVNMDGTALYQGVAAAFIAQVYGLPLSLSDQVEIVLMATLASIGTAAVPGAGIVMLVMVLKAVGVPVDGIALIVGIDRLLDMCRTVVNVTGDAAVAVVVAASEGELGVPDSASPEREFNNLSSI
jgi:Na+/H+-dicarboxylate symporter